MKRLRDDIVRAGGADPLDLMRQGIRSDETRRKYEHMLRMITCKFLEDILEGTYEERVAHLVKRGRDDPAWTRDLLLNLSRKLRERTKLPIDDKNYLNPISFNNYFSPIKKLFNMNNVAMSWKRIHATYPELDNMPDSMGWARGEISKMSKNTRDTLDRAIILVLASSGIRVGALNQLNWGDLTPVYRNGGKLTLDPGGDSAEVACAMLEVYRGSAEGYTAFITPEAFAALQEYAYAWFRRMGRQAGPEDPMFLVMRSVPKRITQKAIHKRMEHVVMRTGLRDGDRQGKMHRVPLMNGFRRFFNKTCMEALGSGAPPASLIKHEFMTGHSRLTSLDENYKADALKLAAEYVKAVPDLTIDDTERLRRTNRALAEKMQRLKDEDAKMGGWSGRYGA